MFFEVADPSEISRRPRSEVFVTQVEVPMGALRVLEGGAISVPVPLYATVRHETVLRIIRQAGCGRRSSRLTSDSINPGSGLSGQVKLPPSLRTSRAFGGAKGIYQQRSSVSAPQRAFVNLIWPTLML